MVKYSGLRKTLPTLEVSLFALLCLGSEGQGSWLRVSSTKEIATTKTILTFYKLLGITDNWLQPIYVKTAHISSVGRQQHSIPKRKQTFFKVRKVCLTF